MPEISVIVPFRDAERFIGRCVESLLRQDLPRDAYEVLLVDNGSSDASAGIVARHPELRLLREPKAGAYAARNRGAREARGRILAFTDPDCEVADDWLSRVRAALGAEGALVVLGRRDFHGAAPGLALLAAYERAKDATVFASLVPEIYYGYTNNMAVRRDVFERVGPFAEQPRGSDTAFVQELATRSGCEGIRYDPLLRVVHLELDGVPRYLRKVYLYGRSRSEFPLAPGARALDLRERLLIFRLAREQERLSPARAGLLLALLGIGWLCWSAGALHGRLRRAS